MYRSPQSVGTLFVLQLNFWRDNGGIAYYVKETLGPGHNPEEFFLHAAPQVAFRHWVRSSETHQPSGAVENC